jgi:hypothetical protein
LASINESPELLLAEDTTLKPDTAPTGPTDEGQTDETVDDESEVSVGEIPVIETVELTADTARRALDVYVVIRDKYKDAELENYESLQEFVDQHPRGKEFDADIKAAGFATVDGWNLAVSTLSLAYGNIVDNQTEDIKQQVDEIKAESDMAQDMKDRMIKSLEAMIPSDNNTKIVEELIKDQAYAEKLKSLDVESE